MKILFVCLGNICRSPLAEGIMKQIEPDFRIESAGTSDYHIGQSPDHRMIKTAQKHGIDLSPLKARQLTTDDFDQFDYIYVMDKNNYIDVLSLTKTDDHKSKIRFMLENNEDVPDPYFGGEDGFVKVYKLLLDGCQRISNAFRKR